MKPMHFTSPADRSRIGSMLLHMTPEDVADTLGITVGDVLAIAPANALRPVRLTCLDTGRTWDVRSERAAYLRVCVYGLTNWRAHFLGAAA